MVGDNGLEPLTLSV